MFEALLESTSRGGAPGVEAEEEGRVAAKAAGGEEAAVVVADVEWPGSLW